MQRCGQCASIFHYHCNRKQTECPACSAGNIPIDIVLKATATKQKKVWPALVIHNDQVPEYIYRQRRDALGYVFVFVIGKLTYEQVHASDLLPFRIDK